MNDKIFLPEVQLISLELRNYRGFPYLPTIKFDDNLTVIIGNNGSGKTTLLDGVAVFMQYFVYEIILGKSDYELSIQPKDIKNGTGAADLTAEFSVSFEFLEKETLKELSSIIDKLNSELRYEYEGKEVELVFSEGDWFLSIDKNENYDLIPIETQLSIQNDNFLLARFNGAKWNLAINHETFANEGKNLWNSQDYTNVNFKIQLGYNRKDVKPTINANNELIEQLRVSFRNHWEVKRQPLPIFAYYGSSEISTKVAYIPDFRLSFEQIYSEVLSPTNFSLNTIYNWFRSKQEIANHERKAKSDVAFDVLEKEVNYIQSNFEKILEKKDGNNKFVADMLKKLIRNYKTDIATVEAEQQLNLVKKAVIEMLTDETATYSDLQVSFDSVTKEAHLSIKKQMPHESGPTALALNQLSSGEKHLLAIVADLAIRMIELNPGVINPLSEGKGIVNIDEIDTHLHPLWQRKVLEKLRNMFPLLQIDTTTHSPFVASLPPKIKDNHKLDRNIIYELENGNVREARYGSGQSIDYILSELMDIDHRNKIVEDYIYLIREEEHESDKGKELKLIIDELDPNSSDMMRINFALQRLKARKR